MTQADRIRGEALVKVRHLTGVELDIGSADTDPLDVDHRLAGCRDGNGHLLDRAFPRAGHDHGPHGGGAHRGFSGSGPPVRMKYMVEAPGPIT